MIRTAHQNGHFYSPVLDPEELASRLDELYPADPKIHRVDFNVASHLALIEQALMRFMPDYDYPETGPSDEELSFFIRATVNLAGLIRAPCFVSCDFGSQSVWWR